MDRNIELLPRGGWGARVALRKESVDRNIIKSINYLGCFRVALRKESVDRNIPALGRGLFLTVALRKESVDRNVH